MTTHTHALAALALASLATTVACDGSASDADLGTTDSAFTANEALGMLDFLNGPAATVETLDVTIGIDKRAATNIVAHVRGKDGKLGTGDDDRLDTIAELDAIGYVASVAMNKILVYVQTHGLVPAAVADGVAFTSAEAAGVLKLANEATQAQLDGGAGLDQRAADNIVGARPLASLAALDAVPYVGKTAFQKLKAYLAVWRPAAPTSPTTPTTPTTCALTFTARADAALDGAEAVVVDHATGDWPPFAFNGMTLAGCDATAIRAVESQLAGVLAPRVYSDWNLSGITPSPIHARALQVGGERFAAIVGEAIEWLAEHSDTPDSDASAFSALTAGVTAAPGEYLELELNFEAEECSQDAVVLFHPADGKVSIARRYPRC